MARPKSYKTDDVLKNAMTVFWKRGFVATSMADIYAATGLKPGNLYASFTDKDTLFRRAFEVYADNFRATLPTGAEGLAAIRAWLAVQARLATEDPDRKGCLIVNTVTEREAHGPETRALAQQRMAEITGFFRHHVGLAQERGEISATIEATQAAAGLTGAVVAIMAMARGGADTATIHAIAAQALAALGVSAGSGHPAPHG